MLSRTRRLGLEGENTAARYLVAQGFKLVARNWRGRSGEIDLVCEDAETLVFVEVKARASTACGGPEEAVDRRKLAKLRQVAAEYLAREQCGERPCRFDVVAVRLLPGHEAQIQHLRCVDL